MTLFSNLKAHPETKAILSHLVESQKLPKTLLFHGISGVGKLSFAIEFARYRLKTQKKDPPDLRVIKSSGKAQLITMESALKIIENAKEPPFESKEKWILIDDAHRLHTAAANALLKTLEEPIETTHFILVASSRNALLPTILSRSHSLYFPPLQDRWIEEEFEEEESRDLLTKIAAGSLGRALMLKNSKELLQLIHSFLQEKRVLEKLEIARKIEEECLVEGELSFEKFDLLCDSLAVFGGRSFYSKVEAMRENGDRNIKLRHLLETL
ncbi:MAG: AAA family ATPase [Simkaniaceae bacterium]